MNAPIKIRDTVALLFAIGLAAVGLGDGVSADLHLPAARLLVAECQGFEALASAGSKKLTCNAGVVMADPTTSFAQTRTGVADGHPRT